MIGRRALVALAAATLAAARAAAQGGRPRRVGIVRLTSRPPDDDIQIAGLRDALAALGRVEGSNLIVEHGFAEGETTRLSALVADLLRKGVDVLVPVGVSATRAARDATATVPIVAFANVDPVAAGLVDRLGRPTGNVTGVMIAPGGSLAGKRLSLLQEAAPHARRFALLAPEADPAFELQIRETRDAAVAAGVDLLVVGARSETYAAAFGTMTAGGAQALLVGAHQLFVRDRRAVVALAERHRLPAMYEWPHQVAAGGLMSFGANLTERYRRLAHYIDRILGGARPSDLPFEQPAALQLTVNLRAARAIGLDLPPAFLARADEVIE
jgi:putative ABC transport system substrate-binding protein